jgi:hypothetical protein
MSLPPRPHALPPTPPHALDPLEAAIIRTVLYSDVFDCALTAAEIHHYLIHDRPVTMDAICRALEQSAYLRLHLTTGDGYFARADRPELIGLRLERREIAVQRWQQAVECGMWLARLPFVRMVALTGALAAQNPPHAQDDFDYLLVTQTGRVWLARAFAILLVRLGKLRGVLICPNYVLAEDALEQSKRDLFMAREVAQMTPLYGLETYEAMRRANRWTQLHLPNALTTFNDLPPADSPRKRTSWISLKYAAEWLLGGALGDALEKWEYQRKQRRFSEPLQTPHSSAQIDRSHVKGHFNDHGHPVLRRFTERLRLYHLEQPQPQVGD